MATVDDRLMPAEEEVILLTRVVEEPPIEPVLELTDEEGDLPAGLQEPPRPAVASPPGADTDDSLADLLAALKEMPPDFAAREEPPAAQEAPVTTALPLPEEEVAAVVRQVAAEIIERLAREIVPQVAERLVAEEIRALKERLCRQD